MGFDAVDDYYDSSLKWRRLSQLEELSRNYSGSYVYIRANLSDRKALENCFSLHRFDRVIHLAARAGVRESLINPHDVVESNIVGFTNILEACRGAAIPHLTYASSSSVYGANGKSPSSEHEPADHPLQLYAASKRANELMAHAYSHLFSLPTTGLRFFTVYGPWCRPDMALSIFTRKILAGEVVPLFNHGHHTRDFTYIDDIVEGMIRASDQVARSNLSWDPSAPDPQSSSAPWRLLNIGSHRRVTLVEYLEAIEAALGMKAIRSYLPQQPGDVADTLADTTALAAAVGYQPTTSIQDGIARFVEWYKGYYIGDAQLGTGGNESLG